ncbi:Down syndrome cell adhesion molecule-like protein Dscam2 [Nymphon striatum]|nr:Down syndrome cell adhesion molecule-like protein Dscam2 [Nymphon striatum]
MQQLQEPPVQHHNLSSTTLVKREDNKDRAKLDEDYLYFLLTRVKQDVVLFLVRLKLSVIFSCFSTTSCHDYAFLNFMCLTNIDRHDSRYSIPQSSVPPRINDRISSLIVKEGFTAEFPCAAQSFPLPKYRWLKFEENQEKYAEVQLSRRIVQLSGSLFVQSVQPKDSGQYKCFIENGVGSESVTTILKVNDFKPIDRDWATTDYDTSNTKFAIRRQGRHSTLQIKSVHSEQEGMYQCMVKNNENIVAQGTAQLLLGAWTMMNSRREPEIAVTEQGRNQDSPDFQQNLQIWTRTVGRLRCQRQLVETDNDCSGLLDCINNCSTRYAIIAGASYKLPKLNAKFTSEVLKPGSSVSLECKATGTPLPKIQWFHNDKLVTSKDNIIVMSIIKYSDTAISVLNITNIRINTSGLFKCSATNTAGTISHSDRINVLGEAEIRPLENVSVITGLNFTLTCHIAGYPLPSIHWQKGGLEGPITFAKINSKLDNKNICNNFITSHIIDVHQNTSFLSQSMAKSCQLALNTLILRMALCIFEISKKKRMKADILVLLDLQHRRYKLDICS